MIHRKQYDNGLVVVCKEVLGRSVTSLIVGINVGSKNDPERQEGCAHLLEHMLFSSNEFRTQSEIVEAGEFSGMNFNAHTSKISTEMEFILPSEQLRLALELAYQSVLSRECCEEELHREKTGPVTDELRKNEMKLEKKFFVRVMYPRVFLGTPFDHAVIGTLDSLKNLTLSDLIKMKDMFYVPNNMVISAAGSLNPDLFFSEIESSFATMNRSVVVQPEINWTLTPGVEYVVFPELKGSDKDHDHAYLHIIYQVNPPNSVDSSCLSLISYMIGQGHTSLLFKKLRNERGIGYSPSASYSSLEQCATFRVGLSGLHPLKIEESAQVMFKIIDDIKQGNLTDDFLEGKKNQLISNLLIGMETEVGNSTYLMGSEFREYVYKTPELLIEAIRKITREQVQEVAQRNFSREPLIVIASAPGYKNIFTQYQ